MVARLGAGAALAIWLGSEGYRDIGAKVRDIPARPAAIRRMRDRPVLVHRMDRPVHPGEWSAASARSRWA